MILLTTLMSLTALRTTCVLQNYPDILYSLCISWLCNRLADYMLNDYVDTALCRINQDRAYFVDDAIQDMVLHIEKHNCEFSFL